MLKMYFPMSFLETETFLTEWPFLKRMGYISLAGMAQMHKVTFNSNAKFSLIFSTFQSGH